MPWGRVSYEGALHQVPDARKQKLSVLFLHASRKKGGRRVEL